MNKPELFASIAILNERLAEHRRTGVLTFKDVEEKLLISKVYKELYPHVTPDLNCVHCILTYLCSLHAYYVREFPKYLKSIEPVADLAPQDPAPEPLNDTYAEPAKPKKKYVRKKK